MTKYKLVYDAKTTTLSISVHTETLNPYPFATPQCPLEISNTLKNWPGGY
jgi:hypothetical protein